MHKPDYDDYDDELIETESKTEDQDEDEGCCSSYCTKCTGLSLRDFM